MPLDSHFFASRRQFLLSSLAALSSANALPQPGENQAKIRTPPYLALQKYIEAGSDQFAGERVAMEIRSALHRATESFELPLVASPQGFSPFPASYNQLASDLTAARYDKSDRAIADGWKKWLEALGTIHRIAFYILPGDIVQYEVASESGGLLHYRTGQWQQTWEGVKIRSFRPIEEHVLSSHEPYFRDVTAAVFENTVSFRDQLTRGIPYWRSRLDPATGIDIYGSNGIAVGDIDGDGTDEIYVCQPGGLPNRLYRVGPGYTLLDITEQWNVGLLDDTSCALFLDLRNIGRQDLVVLRSGGPELFINQANRFFHKEDAFRFTIPPAGGFTGMAAADFDRNGKLDLYLCCYVYFQSEAQFTYASPYYDAQNGPPNFLFRNELQLDGSGWFQDCTSETGLQQNNNRFSFAPAWCDFNNDGWPDLYVANDFGRKNLYVNKDGHFQDLAQQAGVEDIGPGMSANWCDYDGDGWPDLYVANMWSDAGQRIVRDRNFAPAKDASATEGYQLHTRGNSLYRNKGDGTFEDVSVAQHVNFGRWAWASGGHDLDNDGHPEMFVTCGMLTNTSRIDLMGFFWRQVVAKSPGQAVASDAYQNGWNAINQFVREDYSWSGHEPNVLHIRRGDRYFDASGISGLDFAEDSRAFAITDFDGDGRPDFILKSRLGPQVRVLQNNCAQQNHSVAFQLQGTKSNRDAIGAKVRVGGQTKWLEAGSGFLSQHSKRLLFGLGDKAEVPEVQVLWPSGEQQHFQNLHPGFTYFLKEGSPEIHSQAFQQPVRLSSKPVSGDNTLALQDTWLAEPLPLPEPQTGPALLVLNKGFGPAERRQQYEIFRRYLFDWRTSLQTPMAFLLNANGQAVKVYAAVPSQKQYQSDLAQIDRHPQLALPFAGTYIVPPQRDIFKFGVAFLWSGFTAQALPYLLEKIRRAPGNPRVLTLLGQIYLLQEDFNSAEKYFTQAAHFDPKAAENFYGLGLALARQNKLAQARDNFQQAIVLRPAYPDAINDLGALYMQLGQTNDAIAAFRYGLEVSPDEDILYMNLARSYVKLGQIDRAREIMQRLLDRKPDNVSARNGLQELNGR